MSRLKEVAGLLIGGSVTILLVKFFPQAFGVSILNDDNLNHWISGLVIAGAGLMVIDNRWQRDHLDA